MCKRSCSATADVYHMPAQHLLQLYNFYCNIVRHTSCGYFVVASFSKGFNFVAPGKIKSTIGFDLNEDIFKTLGRDGNDLLHAVPK